MSGTSLQTPKVSERLLQAPALVARLKVCALQHDLHRGRRLHAAIQEKGLLKNVFIASSLVNLYAKCGALTKATAVFDELPVRDVFTWTALIAGYAQRGHGEHALYLYESMHHEGLPPTAATFACILKSCGSINACEKGHEVHAEIVEKGLLDKNKVLRTALVDMYAKCDALDCAQQMFDELCNRDPVSWTALITGYAQHGHCERAIQCFKQMQLEGSSPSAVTFACMLQACGTLRAGKRGMEIHSMIVKEGFWESDAVLGSALMEFYLKCDELTKAQQVFDELPTRNLVCWTGLITGYCNQGHGEEALHCFDQMRSEGIPPNAMTFASTLKACGSIGASEKGKALHAEMLRQGLLETDTVLGNALVDMYAKCGALAKAQDSFEEVRVPNIVSLNALISGYCQHGHPEEALSCYEKMRAKELWPDPVTLLCVLQACASIGSLDKGKEIHAEIVKEDLLATNRPIGNALVEMYAKCGLLTKAQKVFDELLVRDSVTWNALIAGYCQHGHNEEVLNCFAKMQKEGLSPIAPTFARILKACGRIGAIEKGKEVQTEISKEGLLGKDSVLGTALVDMYAKFGELAKARKVFDELPCKDAAAWTALIRGYCQHGYFEDSLNCFELMQLAGVPADAMTLACILKACGSLGAAEKGEEVHVAIVKEGFLGEDSVLGSALLDMYSKCGNVRKAQEVFAKLPHRDVLSWTTLISGYAQLGKQKLVLSFFDKMIEDDIKPNSFTFTVVLNACSGLGLVREGERYFEIMCMTYNITPSLEHYNCIVSLLAHAAHFDKAMQMMAKEPLSDSLPAWLSLLSACQKWENMKLGEIAFSNAFRLKDALASVYMSNSYASASWRSRNSKLMKDKTVMQGTCCIDDCKLDDFLYVGKTGFLLRRGCVS